MQFEARTILARSHATSVAPMNEALASPEPNGALVYGLVLNREMDKTSFSTPSKGGSVMLER